MKLLIKVLRGVKKWSKNEIVLSVIIPSIPSSEKFSLILNLKKYLLEINPLEMTVNIIVKLFKKISIMLSHRNMA